MRLDKFICEIENCTRKEAKDYIKKGLISVNGNKTKDASLNVEEENKVFLKGKELKYTAFSYIMLYKPKGVVSAVKDDKDKTVIDVLPKTYKRRGLFPVGRLDKDTTGLLIISNDGAFAHNSLSPTKHVEKEYGVTYQGTLPENAEEEFLKGIDLGKYICKSAKIEVLAENKAKVTLSEGKFHQVKRMFEALGCKVTELKRLRFGKILLDESLKEGEARYLTECEVKYIQSLKGE